MDTTNLLKTFRIQFLIILIISFSLIGSTILIQTSSAQSDPQIPNWIKDVAGWWADDAISQDEFLSGIEYLINNNIIQLDYMHCISDSDTNATVPDWIKNNAKWWSEDLINNNDFVNGIKYLIKKQIITVDNREILGEVPMEDVIFSSSWNFDLDTLVFVQSSFFEIYGVQGNCIILEDGFSNWTHLVVGLDPDKMGIYDQVAAWNNPEKTVVVYPYFTYSAYAESGFYDYYKGKCDTCTTTKLQEYTSPLYTSSGTGHQVLTLLGYTSITDVTIDKNPDILQQFDKVIMLHSEYVTRTMFDAITSHPNVVYLYPNALYAEITVNYEDSTMTLIRGHNYPDSDILNGFDWEFDNTHPYEYDNDCFKMRFYQIPQGWMTNCYPENVFFNPDQVFTLLKAIDEL